jgi:hypothetical protein
MSTGYLDEPGYILPDLALDGSLAGPLYPVPFLQAILPFSAVMAPIQRWFIFTRARSG